MPNIKVNGAELYYEDTGGIGKEVIVFSHSLFLNCRMFDAQVAAFSSRFRCITYDHRGQGQSEVTASGYDMETVYEDAAQLIRALDAAPCHFVGVEMGGYIGMRIASRQPNLLQSLTLIETSADRDAEQDLSRSTTKLPQALSWIRSGPALQPSMEGLFGQKFLADPSRAVQREEIKRQIGAINRATIVRAAAGVMTRHSIYDELVNIHIPTLILVGDQDVATIAEKSKRMAAKIPSAKMGMIPGAGHSATIEEPEMVNKLLELFINNLKRDW
ncbi:MAG: alpha/beta fold hydrolase [Chloroflexota bacterium]